MSDHPAPAAGGLDDLAAATRAYAAYGTTAFGLAGSAWGGLLLLGALATWGSPSWGPLLLFPTVPAWFLLLRRARAFYQARGAVLGAEDGMSRRRARQNGLVALILACGYVILRIARHRAAWAASQGTPAEAAMALAVLCTLLGFGMAVAWGRGYRDTYTPFIVVWFWVLSVTGGQGFLPASQSDALATVVLLGGLGLFFAVRGGHEHEAWKALDRRLARLRTTAP